MKNPGKRVIIVAGPTASGKTDYAIELAIKYGSPIISCDSRQIYKELLIGTAPPSAGQLARVKHYFIFSHSIFNHYTAGKYEMEANALAGDLFRIYDTLIMVGGSGLYIDAFCNGIDDFPESDLELRGQLISRLEAEGLDSLRSELMVLDPKSLSEIDVNNPQRILRALEVCISTGRPFSSFKTSPAKQRDFEIEKIILSPPRDELYDRINRRVDDMLASGLVEEARSLYPHRHLTALRTVGYKELFDHFDGKLSLDEAISLIKQDTRRYAKRQVTWFKR
jgi:tRNA dimethylallyltransferase